MNARRDIGSGEMIDDISGELVDAYGVLSDPGREWLLRQGVPATAIIMYPGPVGMNRVTLHGGRFFEPDEDGRLAFVQPVWPGDAFKGDPIDIAAWFPKCPGRAWTRMGVGVFLGEANVVRARVYETPLSVYRSPLEWLQAGGHGAAILDALLARKDLMALGEVRAQSIEHGNEVDALLRSSVAVGTRVMVPRRKAA